MHPKIYIPILWLLAHVILPVFIAVSTTIFLIGGSILHEFIRAYTRIVFQ